MSESQVVLKLAHVTKSYDSVVGGSPVCVLNDISLEVKQGESLAVVGPSGSGKSTLLNVIGTLDRASQGKVLLDGSDVGQMDETQLAAVRNRTIGFVFQAHHLLPHCSVIENVLLPTLPLKDPALRDTAPARAARLLERVGMSTRTSHRPGQLSGGERQRVAVVRALINQPKVLLADEPTGALDHTAAHELGQLLVELNKDQGVTLILVTHALDLANRMGRAMELRDGRLAELESVGHPHN
jgi:ABC-type lipoprotein export system ATPase subunit